MRSAPGARLIVTTREHILTQATARSERLREAHLDELRLVLRMASYSTEQRAEILYNHLHFGDLPAAYREEILTDDFYMGIVKHTNFNPRIVEWLSSYGRVQRVAVGEYRTVVGGLLEDQSEIWRHAYEQQISDAARSLLLALFSLGGTAERETLEEAYARLHRARCRRYGLRERLEDFSSALRELTGAFLTLDDPSRVRVLDPSVLDLMNTVVGEAPENAVDIVSAAIYFGQIGRIWAFFTTAKGERIQSRLATEAKGLVQTLRTCMVRRPNRTAGEWGQGWSALEDRFELLVEMADRMRSAGMVQSVLELFEELLKDWASSGPRFDVGRKVLDAIAASEALTSEDAEEMSKAVRNAMLRSMEVDGYWLGELTGMAPIAEECEVPEEALKVVGRVMGEYERKVFSDELSQCESSDAADELARSLKDLCAIAGVDVSDMLVQTEKVKEELREMEAELQAQEDDAWMDSQYEKEQSRKRERSDGAIKEMFGSLN